MYALIRNEGTAPLTSLNFNWTVNSVAQTQGSWTGTLNPGDTATVLVGNYTISGGSTFNIQVVSANPNGLTDPNTSNDTISSSGIGSFMNGNYTIGSGGDFLNLNAARSALVTNGICGHVTFNILAGTYSESLSLPQIVGAGPSATITFQNAGSDSTLVVISNTAIPVIAFAAGDYYTFRKVTVQTTGTGTTSRVIEFNGGATNNRFENCRLIGSSTTNTSTTRAVIYSVTNTLQDNDNVFLNNVIQGGSYGIYWDGLTASPYESGMLIEGNTFSGAQVRPIFLQAMSAPIIRNNTIDHTTTTSTAVYALSCTNCYNATQITGNYIQTKQFGLFLSNVQGTGGARAKVYNNIIIANPASSLATYGIQLNGSAFVNVYHNSINLVNNFVPAVASYCIYDQSGSNNTYRNNIFKQRGGAGSNDFLIFTTTSGVGNSYDYNNYSWNPGSTNIGSLDGTVYSVANSNTFLAGGVGGANSLALDPEFVSNTNLRPAQVLLNAGTNLLTEVGLDFNDSVRISPPTMGALECRPPNDDAAPISIAPALPCPGVNQVSAVVRNFGAAPITSLTFNWSVNGVPQTPFNWTGNIALGVNSTPINIGTYNFAYAGTYTIRVTTSLPNGNTDAIVSNDTTVRTVITALGGTYTIGSGGNYATFASAVSDLNTYGVCGPVTFNVISGTYTEAPVIPQIAGVGSGATITFQSLAGDSTAVILQSNVNPVVTINGADYIRIRKITIATTSTSTTAGRTIDFNATSTNNTIEYCQLNGNSNTGTSAARSVITSLSTTTTNDSANVIQCNRIRGGSHGIYWDGFSTLPYESGLVIHKNDIAGAQVRPILLNNVRAAIVSQNTIDHSSTTATGVYAMSINNGTDSCKIFRNRIVSEQHGILLSNITGTSSAKTQVYNNYISCLPGGTVTPLYGIQFSSATHVNTDHNSINIVNPFSGSTSSVIYDVNGTNLTFRNNIFRLEGADDPLDYIVNQTAAGTGNSYDYNNYVWNATAPNIATINGSVISVTNSMTFLAGGVGGANSLSLEPGFQSTTSLRHSANPLNAGLDLTGSIPTDINGTTRTNPVTMGAYEFKPGADDAGIVGINPLYPCLGVNNVEVSLRNFGSQNLTGVTINWRVNGVDQTPFIWAGTLAPSVNTPVTIGTYNFALNGTYTLKAWTSSPNLATDSNNANDSTQTSVLTALSGNYTIGSGGDFATFNQARNALVTYGVCGNATFNVVSGTYTEFFSLPAIPGAASNRLITFQSQSGDSTSVILQSSNSPVINFSGADYVRFARMTIQTSSTSTTNGKVIDVNSTSTQNTIEHCRLIGNSNTGINTARSVVFSISSATNDAGMVILNNVISGGSYGIYWDGYSIAPYEDGMVVFGNTFSGAQVRPILLQNLAGVVCSENDINHATTSATSVYALSLTNCYDGSTVSRNRIVTKQHGILLSNVVGTSGQRILVNNNAISSVPGSSLTTYGLHLNPASYVNVWHNSTNMINPYTTNYSVYDQAGSNNSYRNNIFRNVGIGTTADVVVFSTGAATGTTYDYNSIVWTPSALNIASINGTVYSVTNSINYFVNGVGGLNSIHANPGYVSNTNLIHTSVLVNFGLDLTSAIPVDLEGSARTAPPTMGAYEYKPGQNDAGITGILPLLPCPGATPVQVSIRNYGVLNLTSATVHWTVNGVPQSPFSWSGTITPSANSAPVTIGTYNFVASTSYSIVAWTTSPNGVADQDIHNDTLSVAVTTALGGTYSIGSGGDYASVTAARNDLVTFGVCGPVTFNIFPGTYTEAINLPAINGAGPGSTIIFQSATLDSTDVIIQNTTNPVWNMAGADYVIIRNLTIQTTATSTTAARVIDFNTASTQNTISNCRLIGNSVAGNSTGRSVVSSISTGTNESFNQILNNVIQGGSYGIYWDGFSSAPYETGLVISGNTIFDSYTRSAAFLNTSGLVLINNSMDLTSTVNTAVYAVSLTSCFNDFRVTGNRIVTKQHGLFLSSADGTSLLRGLVANNFISANPPASLVTYGIHLASTDYVNVYHNSINVLNPFTTCYGIYNQSGTNDAVQNNIVRVMGSGSATDYVLFTSGAGTGNVYNYNDYVWNPAAPNVASINGTVYTVSNSINFFANGVGGENSVSIEPGFASFTDLMHSTIALNVGLNLISTVPSDINGVARVNPVTIGATEYKPGPNDAGIVQILPAIPCQGANNMQVVIRNYGTDNLTSATISWSVNSVPQTPFNWTGFVLPGGNSAPVTVGTFNFVTATSYAITASSSSPNGFSDSNNANNSNSNNVTTALGGAYTIGSGGDYSTPALAIADLVSYGICGPVTFNILNGTYTGNLVIPEILGAGSSRTITFQSASGDSSLAIIQSNVSPVIDLDGVDYLRISKVTIQTTNTLTTAGMVIGINSTASDNTIENCRLIGNNNTGTSTARAVVASLSTTSFNSNTLIRNNNISGGSYGIYLDGFNAAPYEPGIVITGNTLSGAHARSVYLQYLDAPIFSGNSVDHTTTAASSSVYAVSVANCYNNVQVTRNLIRGKQHGLYLTTVVGTTLQRAQISNNWISCSPTISLITYGLHANACQYSDVFHNSINVENTFTSSYGLYSQSNTNTAFKNNIIRAVGNVLSTHYVLYTSGAGTGNVIDYNDYVWQSGAPNIANLAGTVYSVSNSINFLSGGVGGSHSVNVNPNFVGVSNLNTCAFGLNVGENLTSVTSDYNGLTRRGANRSIGAVEVPEMPATPTGLVASVVRCNEFDVNWNIGNSTTGYQVQVSTNPGFTSLVTGFNPMVTGLTNSLNVFGLNANTTYYVRLRGINACGNGSYSAPVAVSTIQVADSVVVSSNSPVCSGSNLTLSAVSPLPGITYSWSGPGGFNASGANVTRNGITGSGSGVYTLTASSIGCSPVSLTSTVSVNNPITVVAVGGNTTLCSGETLIMTADATEPGVVYNWTGPNGFTANGPSAAIASIQTILGGIYSVTATSPGCNQLTDGLVVTVIPTITVNLSSNSPVCEQNPIRITLTPQPAASFYWMGPNGFTSNLQNPSVANATLSSAGFYTLFVNQPGCNTLSYSTQVLVGSNLASMGITSNTPVCAGGAIQLSGTVFPSATYNWYGPSGYSASGNFPTRPLATTAMTGNYTLVATSPGCAAVTRTHLMTVTTYSGLSPSYNGPVCQSSPIYLSATNYGGATYQWSGPLGFTSNVRGAGISNAQPNMSGDYSLTATIPGCGTQSSTLTVLVGSPLTNVSATSNSPVCEGGDLQLSITDLAGVSYSWFGPAGFTSLAPEPVVPAVDNSANGIYTVNVVSPGCGSTTRVVTARIAAPIVVSPGVVNNPICVGSQILLTTNTVSFGSYSWSGPGGFVSTAQNAGISNAQLSNAGDYTLTVTEPACGTASSTVSVQIGNSLQGLAAGGNSPVCVGGTINLSAVNRSEVTYLWSGPNGFTSNSVTPSIVGATALDGGVYSLSVSTPGCGTLVYTVNIQVTVPGSFSASSNTPVCSGNIINLSATGGPFSTYSWSGPNGYTSSTRNPGIALAQTLNSGVYTLSINDPGCGITTLTTTVSVSANVANSAALSNSPVCSGGTLNLSATTFAGATYNWEGPNGFNSSAQNPTIAGVSALDAGVYSLTISTPGCESASRTASVMVNPALVVNPSSNSPVCQGSVLYLSANIQSGVTYLWQGPNGFTSAQANPSIINVSPLSSGVFTLSITQNGCGTVSGTASVTIGGSVSGLTLSTNSPVCAGNTLNLSSSTINGSTLLWTGPDGFTSSSQNISRAAVLTSAGGVYTLVASSPGCGTTSRTISTVVNPAVVLNAGSNSPICQGSVLALTVNSVSGSSYSWFGPSGYVSASQNPTISNAATSRSGIYTLVVNSTSCGSLSTTTSVSVGSTLASIAITSNSPVCQGNNLTLTATDRTGFQFSWTGPNGFTSNLAQPVVTGATSLNSGRYSLTIVSPGCGTTSLQTAVLTVNNPAGVSASSNSPVCVGSPIYFTGAAPTGSTFSWSGPAGFVSAVQNPSRSGATLLHAGVYTLSATVPGCGAVTTTTTVVVNTCRQSQDNPVISGQQVTAGNESDKNLTNGESSSLTVRTMNLWPNPNAGQEVHYSIPGLGNSDKSVTLRILDALGRQVWVESVKYDLGGSIEGTLNLSGKLSKGMYTVEAVQEGETYHARMVVE